MKMRNFICLVILSASTVFFISNCARSGKTSLSLEVAELAPGVLEGYLPREEMINSLLLVPPPPEEGSAAWDLDQEVAQKWVGSEDEARREQAAIDAVLHFPDALMSFNGILDIQVSEEHTPHLYMIMRRSLADAGLSTYTAKNHYARERPFMVNGAPTCTPQDEEALRKDGSYPSGHTAIGWAWALILSEVFPEKAEMILLRGMEFGISRNVCNVHWHSDVVAGRLCGAAAVAKMHTSETFQADLEAAKKEVEALRP
jgi:acid phosphatase (class A)